MREQQNPSTPELHQPLLFAPSELLACGLRDAHHHPLVGVRTEDGVRSWRTSPATAWEHPLVEWARTATSTQRARPPNAGPSPSICEAGTGGKTPSKPRHSGKYPVDEAVLASWFR